MFLPIVYGFLVFFVFPPIIKVFRHAQLEAARSTQLLFNKGTFEAATRLPRHARDGALALARHHDPRERVLL